MSTRLRWAAAAVAALVTVGLVPSPASAGVPSGSFDDQEVVEVTRPGTPDGASGGLGFHRTRADEVSANNAAVAYAACDGCRAVALSFQVVLASRGPTDIEANNLALAMTENCSGCEALAMAHQVVVASDGRLRLSDRGRSRLKAVRNDLERLAGSDRPLLEIRAEVQALMERVSEIVANDLRTRPVIRSKERLDRD